MWRVSLAAAACLLCLGCVENAFYQSRIPFEYGPLPEPAPATPSEGAIWDGDSAGGSFLFFDNKAQGLGDLVTVMVNESLSAQGEAATETERTTTIDADVTSDIGFQDLVKDGVEKLLGMIGIDVDERNVPSGTTLIALESENSSSFEGDGTTERRGSFTGVITCRVVNVLPGEVYHLRGRRQIIVNHESQWVTIEGLARKQDIGIDNKIMSTQMAEVRMSFDGIGVIDDKQRPGTIARLLDWIYPF